MKEIIKKYSTASGDDESRNLSKFLAIPDAEEERHCYQAFYDATSNQALLLRICPICAREKFAREGEETMLLSDQSVVDVLTVNREDGNEGRNVVVLRDLLETSDGGVNCWMCFECLKALERRSLPKFALANNLWIGNVPDVLTALTIPEQLLIARHYPRCYIFKLFPRDCGRHLPLDQLYSGMAGNASLFEINTQEVVEMLKGQHMPSPVITLASVIAITFVGSKKLPVDWLKKTFRVRRFVVYEALAWLRGNNPLYEDIVIDPSRLEELPEDDLPDALMAVIRQEEDDEVAERERASYVINEMEISSENDGIEDNSGGNEDGVFLSVKNFNF